MITFDVSIADANDAARAKAAAASLGAPYIPPTAQHRKERAVSIVARDDKRQMWGTLSAIATDDVHEAFGVARLQMQHSYGFDCPATLCPCGSCARMVTN